MDNLKDCFEFCQIEYSALLRHLPTRWLSLLPAIDRLLHNWPVIKVYIIQRGEDECPKQIWDFICDQENEVADDNNLTLNECYLYFVHNFMNVFQESIKLLENDRIQSTEVYSIMLRLRESIQTKVADEFFRFKVKQCIGKLFLSGKQSFLKAATLVYSRSMQYLEK